MRKLTSHRIITGLFGFIGLERALASIGIIAEMITGAAGHKGLKNARVAWILKDPIRSRFQAMLKVLSEQGALSD
jgi:hypothetical protein